MDSRGTAGQEYLYWDIWASTWNAQIVIQCCAKWMFGIHFLILLEARLLNCIFVLFCIYCTATSLSICTDVNYKNMKNIWCKRVSLQFQNTLFNAMCQKIFWKRFYKIFFPLNYTSEKLEKSCILLQIILSPLLKVVFYALFQIGNFILAVYLYTRIHIRTHYWCIFV